MRNIRVSICSHWLNLFEESSAEACGRIVPEYLKQELPMSFRKTCSEWDEPVQKLPQSEATW